MIEFKDVTKTYPNGVTALKHVNLQIEQGEFVAIIGLSGAGKSTLIRAINRMHDITEGSLIVDGTDVSKLKGKDLRRFRRKIGMIFQSFNLVNRTSVINNVLTANVPDMPFWQVMLGIFSKEQKMKALEALDKVGILDKAYTRCDQLSGGQQQRVALARTLNQNPTIILADEPVASLDPVTAHQVMSDFKRINQEMNISILINIHHVDLALEYADRVIGIRAGEIVFDGPAAKITKDLLDQIYGGSTVPTSKDEQKAKEPDPADPDHHACRGYYFSESDRLQPGYRRQTHLPDVGDPREDLPSGLELFSESHRTAAGYDQDVHSRLHHRMPAGAALRDPGVIQHHPE